MTVWPMFRMMCDRCKAADHVTALLDIPTYRGNEKGELVIQYSPVDEALAGAEIMAREDFFRRGWRAGSVDGERKDKVVDLCPRCCKEWTDIGMREYRLVPTTPEEYERSGHLLEFRYVEEGEKNEIDHVRKM